jgi:XTP/dITP diphosphohydrolase
LVFATNNAHKIAEAAPLIGERFALRTLADIGCREELPETGERLEDNAREKANHVWTHYGRSCFSEDTGLEVEALQGAPGVYSARYAGPQRSATDNMAKLLEALGETPNRKARFRTVIALVLDGQWTLFEGICPGRIGTRPAGEGGFGYDPVFFPELPEGPSTRSFAQMSAAEKAQLSHRGQAVRALVAHLRSL